MSDSENTDTMMSEEKVIIDLNANKKSENEVENKVEPVYTVIPEKRIDELKIKYKLNTKVEKILIKNNEVLAVRTDREIIQTDKIILATGGKSYPLTGSTGDGYEILKKLGHTITPIKPSLVPLETYEEDMLMSTISSNLSIETSRFKLTNYTCSKDNNFPIHKYLFVGSLWRR